MRSNARLRTQLCIDLRSELAEYMRLSALVLQQAAAIAASPRARAPPFIARLGRSLAAGATTAAARSGSAAATMSGGGDQNQRQKYCERRRRNENEHYERCRRSTGRRHRRRFELASAHTGDDDDQLGCVIERQRRVEKKVARKKRAIIALGGRATRSKCPKKTSHDEAMTRDAAFCKSDDRREHENRQQQKRRHMALNFGRRRALVDRKASFRALIVQHEAHKNSESS